MTEPQRAGALRYRRFFDFAVRTDASLPELPLGPPSASADRTLDVRFDWHPNVSEAEVGHCLSPWLETSRAVLQGRIGGETLIRYRGVADYRLQATDRQVRCHPVPGADLGAVRHFLLNQVLPRLVSVHTPLVIHAGAVVTAHGAAMLVGPSGIGKSTLATSFDRSKEAAVIADDSVLVRIEDDCVRAIGGYRCCRLRMDSVAALGLADELPHLPPNGGSKRLLYAQGRDGARAGAPVAGIFVLGEVAGDSGAVNLTPLRGTRAVLALVRHAFLLDNSDRHLIGNQFAAAGRLVQTGCPLYCLSYPRRFAQLPEVRARILSVLRPADAGGAQIVAAGASRVGDRVLRPR